jgi:hypothetical protein
LPLGRVIKTVSVSGTVFMGAGDASVVRVAGNDESGT